MRAPFMAEMRKREIAIDIHYCIVGGESKAKGLPLGLPLHVSTSESVSSFQLYSDRLLAETVCDAETVREWDHDNDCMLIKTGSRAHYHIHLRAPFLDKTHQTARVSIGCILG